ncbi:hypothetical protein PE066_02430 [Ramlibacter tataouinensis]|uniref:methylamine utilization protein MauJ n=1 Tax=Ramlibacter tataouinensis TaxID=94132 RepID=UPI0022F3FEB2|nr:methylamine utilization protein MauJ [Ramlibacter tataouinensis]WBY02411.1 hypothetical protein PE066_02430 [Ramlibacter tataouinensis]
MARWMNLGVSGQCGWPGARMEVSFGERSFVLLPQTKETSASIHLESRASQGVEDMTTVNRFLSVVSWAYKDSLRNEYGWSGSPAPIPVPARNLARSINSYFLNKWTPLTDPKQRLALALYREAVSLNSLPYQFLGFFKIINILHKSGAAQMTWIRETLPKLRERGIEERLGWLEKNEADPARYLYESGRCAVAHAFGDPLVDPDDLTDLRRLSADLNVVRALAEYLIKHELQVPDYP